MNEYVDLKVSVNRKKPVTVFGGPQSCPFCDWEELNKSNRILAQDDQILWMENKYPAFEKSYQTVLVETKSCQDHLGTYDAKHRTHMLRFAIEKWLEMKKSSQFKSVALVKNHGAYSGASIQHAHMQLVGFETIDLYHDIRPRDFEGILIQKKDGVELNISSYPRGEAYEFNVIMKSIDQVEVLSEYLRCIVDYILHILNPAYQSFNLLFYDIEEQIIVKIVPRFINTSLYVTGYAVSLRPNNLSDIALDIQEMYFNQPRKR